MIRFPLTIETKPKPRYCPDSPDHVCHYFTEKNSVVAGKVALIPAGFALPTQEIDPERETEDSCLFCGNPDERK